jgi:hypothetical protein
MCELCVCVCACELCCAVQCVRVLCVCVRVCVCACVWQKSVRTRRGQARHEAEPPVQGHHALVVVHCWEHGSAGKAAKLQRMLRGGCANESPAPTALGCWQRQRAAALEPLVRDDLRPCLPGARAVTLCRVLLLLGPALLRSNALHALHVALVLQLMRQPHRWHGVHNHAAQACLQCRPPVCVLLAHAHAVFGLLSLCLAAVAVIAPIVIAAAVVVRATSLLRSLAPTPSLRWPTTILEPVPPPREPGPEAADGSVFATKPTGGILILCRLSLLSMGALELCLQHCRQQEQGVQHLCNT